MQGLLRALPLMTMEVRVEHCAPVALGPVIYEDQFIVTLLVVN